MKLNAAGALVADETFNRMDAESFFIKKLIDRVGDAARRIHDGTTTPADRKDRIRRIILENQFGAERMGLRHGQPETFAQHFARFYGETLSPAQDF